MMRQINAKSGTQPPRPCKLMTLWPLMRTQKSITVPIALDIVTPQAAPTTPIAGNPNLPKMRT